MKTAISSTKKTKQQHKYLRLYILKLLKINISFINSDYFGRLCIGVFLVLSKVSVLVHFHWRIYALLVSNTNRFISLVIHFPFKWPRQEAKTKRQQNERHSQQQQQQAKSVRRRTAISQRNFFWRVVTGTLRWLARLHYLLYFLAFDWLRSAVLFFLNWAVCLFVKESPIWNYSNKSLIRNSTIRKN